MHSNKLIVFETSLHKYQMFFRRLAEITFLVVSRAISGTAWLTDRLWDTMMLYTGCTGSRIPYRIAAKYYLMFPRHR